MTNSTPSTNAQRQAAFREKKEATASFNASEVLRLTKENEELKATLKRVLEASKRAKVQHVSNVAKLRGQLLKEKEKTV
jgi:hypothetical protein